MKIKLSVGLKSTACFLTLLLGLIITHQTLADTNLEEISFEALALKTEVMPRSKRLDQLKLIELTITSLNSVIPAPTPEEIKWIDSEKAEINQTGDETISRPREARLYSSTPYKENEAKSILNSGLFWIGKIRQANDINAEMVYWVKLALAVRDYNTINEALQTIGNIPKKKLDALYLEAALLDTDGTFTVLDRIVIPYLQNSKLSNYTVILDKKQP